jgi:arylsulfatase
LNRPLWPDRPAGIGLGDAGEPPSGAVIEMPTDSFMDIIVRPAEGQQLVGSAAVSLAESGRPAGVWTTIELLDSAGVSREIFRTVFTADSSTEEALQADLSEWVGELVQIRVRTWGDANAIVHWNGLGLSAQSAVEQEAEAHERGGAGESAERGRLLRRAANGERETPDIIIILLDAARADVFSGAGGQPQTPNVDALAAGATRFTAAWSPSAWTGQSVPAVLTGLYPDAVGAEVWGSRLAEGIPTLAERLASAGYFTVLWTQHTIYRGNPSLPRGFEVYEEVVGARSVDNRMQLPDAEDLFAEARPTFAFIHVLPPHEPYEAPEPFRGRYSSWYQGDFEVSADGLNRLQHDLPADEAELDEIIRYARDRYLENVEFADHLVGRLLQELDEAGRLDGALVVVTSDHGEAFLEHGRFLHTVQLYEESIHVPLLVKWPSYMSGFDHEVAQPVTLLDIAPTLIVGLGTGGAMASSPGRSLIPAAFDGVTYDRGLYAYTRGKRRAEEAADPVYAYRSGDYKIIYSPRDDVLRLFDLPQDPGEERDLAASDSLRAKYLLQQAMVQKRANLALLARSGPQQSEALDPETLRQLRALGYVR